MLSGLKTVSGPFGSVRVAKYDVSRVAIRHRTKPTYPYIIKANIQFAKHNEFALVFKPNRSKMKPTKLNAPGSIWTQWIKMKFRLVPNTKCYRDTTANWNFKYACYLVMLLGICVGKQFYKLFTLNILLQFVCLECVKPNWMYPDLSEPNHDRIYG